MAEGIQGNRRSALLRNYLKIFLRNLLRYKEFSLINIGGLAIGMAASLLILIWVQDELNFDKFHEKAGSIYRIIWERQYGDQKIRLARTPTPLGAAAKSENPEIVDFFRYGTFIGEVLIRRGKNAFYETNGAYADPAIFSTLSIKFIKGSPQTAFSNPFCTVITASFARRYFGDSDPVNQLIELENVRDLKVTAVIEDLPKNSHLHFDFLVPFFLHETWGIDLEDWNRSPFYTYVLLDDPKSAPIVNRRLESLGKDHFTNTSNRFFLQPFLDVHLKSDFAYDDMAELGDYTLILVFAIIGLFILIVASINFINLSTVRSITRAKEFGVRKVVGARPAQLRGQYFGESLFHVLIAFILALTGTELISPLAGRILGKSFSLNYLHLPLLILILTVLGLTVLLCGIFPAFLLPSMKPVDILRPAWIPNRKGTLFRRVMVVIQFTISMALITCTLIIFVQLRFIQNRQRSFFQNNIIFFQCRPGLYNRYPAFKQELLQNENILNVSAASNFASYFPINVEEVQWRGKNVNENWQLYCLLVDYDYFEMFDLDMREGRTFSKTVASDSSDAVIINETAAAGMGFGNSVGEKLINYNQEQKIIGVVKDYHFGPLYSNIHPLIIRLRTNYLIYIFVKIRTDAMEETIASIRETWKHYVPDFPFEYRRHGDYLGRVYAADEKLSQFFSYFTILAMFISCLGLYGLASFSAEQKTKEIGIRKVLGSSVFKIVIMLSLDFTKSVLLACLFAWPLAYFLTDYWLGKFAYHASIGIDKFALATAIGFVIAILTVSYQAFRAAHHNPVKSLRYE